jgi:hypothetical protein
MQRAPQTALRATLLRGRLSIMTATLLLRAASRITLHALYLRKKNTIRDSQGLAALFAREASAWTTDIGPGTMELDTTGTQIDSG